MTYHKFEETIYYYRAGRKTHIEHYYDGIYPYWSESLPCMFVALISSSLTDLCIIKLCWCLLES